MDLVDKDSLLSKIGSNMIYGGLTGGVFGVLVLWRKIRYFVLYGMAFGLGWSY